MLLWMPFTHLTLLLVKLTLIKGHLMKIQFSSNYTHIK